MCFHDRVSLNAGRKYCRMHSVEVLCLDHVFNFCYLVLSVSSSFVIIFLMGKRELVA